jgi:hypothetical protein
VWQIPYGRNLGFLDSVDIQFKCESRCNSSVTKEKYFDFLTVVSSSPFFILGYFNLLASKGSSGVGDAATDYREERGNI